MSDQYSAEQLQRMSCPSCACIRGDHERVIDYDWYDMATEDKVTSGSYITCYRCDDCFEEYEPNWELVDSAYHPNSPGYKLSAKPDQDKLDKHHASTRLDNDKPKRYTEQVLDDVDMRNRAENNGL
jgi:hypothetical protein